MPNKRSKRSLKERLTELGLRTSTRKRKKKEASKSDNKSNETSSDSENSSSDNEDVRGPKLHMKPKNKKKPTTQSRNKKQTKSMELSANEIAKLLVQAVDDDLTEALKWLAENLEEVALDQEAEGFDPHSEGTPIVPISREAIEAIGNKLFIKILKSIGVVPPGDEQETYWRIPSNLHFETIRKRREIIIKAINKELVIDNDNNTQTNNDANNDNDESSDDDDLFENLRKIQNIPNKSGSNKSISRSRNRNFDSDDDTTKPNTNKNDLFDKLLNDIPSSSKQSNNRKRSRSIDSDDDNIRKIQKVKKNNDNNDDDDDDDILSFAKKTLQHTELADSEDITSDLAKRSLNSDSEEEMAPVKKHKKLVFSDDSD